VRADEEDVEILIGVSGWKINGSDLQWLLCAGDRKSQPVLWYVYQSSSELCSKMFLLWYSDTVLSTL